ncbi:uncharacterized protein LOC119683486 [Teleopsis dalmanni]|uniref:uncharacterized protein LOC119683486 n=1 Tax=Teleopsis dalmanni TaxID=139649 RepID=UPI0018CF2759|nr:uncharacterized protein LOC119683486 [Teleopsis dalmanni]
MSNTMTAHEPINYLDSILNEEEKRCEYSHQWRNFTISRSGRFKSKNKKRDAVVDAKLFDSAAQKSNDESNNRSNNATAAYNKEQDKYSSRQTSSLHKSFQQQPQQSATSSTSTTKVRDKAGSYKSFYETNL